MIRCVTFADFVAFIESLGFTFDSETEVTLVYLRDDGTPLAVHRPNIHGDITENAALAACYAADVDPVDFDTHWCD